MAGGIYAVHVTRAASKRGINLMDVLAKAVAAIEQADMLSPGGRVAVALSGGADSVALLSSPYTSTISSGGRNLSGTRRLSGSSAGTGRFLSGSTAGTWRPSRARPERGSRKPDGMSVMLYSTRCRPCMDTARWRPPIPGATISKPSCSIWCGAAARAVWPGSHR